MSKNTSYPTTYHRDGTVTVWDCHMQSWRRLAAGDCSDRLLATLDNAERARIARMAAKNAQGD